MACTPGPPPPQPPTPPEATATPEPTLSGTVTLWHAWKENEIASLTEVIAAFQALYPEVQFDVLYTPFDDLRGKFETAVATGGGPTVLIGAADWGPALFDANLVADLSPFMDDAFLGTINPAALGAVQYNGALIGLPQTIKGVVMFRNTSIVPEASATFEDLVANAQAATQGDTMGSFLEYGFFFSAAHINALGGALMDEDGDPAFNDQYGVDWLNLLASFQDAGEVTNYTDDEVNLFKTGQVGVIIDGTWNTSALAEAIGVDNLAIDPWPSSLSGYVQTENIYLSANALEAARPSGNAKFSATDLEASVEFIKFFLSSEAQALLADPSKAAHIPAISGVELTDRLMQESVAAFAGGTAFPVIPEMGAYWDPMNNAVKKVVEEGADAATALQEAFDAVTAKVAEIRGG
ncbi:MAG: extracellular solute-binding protein [Chloroflexi bacterium]|nr:extracellular solute-binding protein [Chloroflexota bacterium]